MPGEMNVKQEHYGSINAKVYRAATGEWEDLGVVCEGPIVEEADGSRRIVNTLIQGVKAVFKPKPKPEGE